MVTYSKYIANTEYNWYDSSNVICSIYHDYPNSPYKDLELIFKGGRTYLYKNISPIDYDMFKSTTSTGEGFHNIIKKKYESIKQNDIDIKILDEMMEKYKALDENGINDLFLTLNDSTGEFEIKSNDILLFKGVERQFSIVDLFKALNIKYNFEIVGNIIKENEYESE